MVLIFIVSPLVPPHQAGSKVVSEVKDNLGPVLSDFKYDNESSDDNC